jgi:periplasmic protein TonB
MDMRSNPLEYDLPIEPSGSPARRDPLIRERQAFTEDREETQEETSNGLRRHGAATAAGVLAFAVIGGIYLFFKSSDDLPPPVKVQQLTLVNILPPPPPPPPPEQKMIEQTPVKQQDFLEQKPVEKPEEEAKEQPKPLEEAKLDMPPPGPLSLDAKAVGPGDSFGLGGKPGGHGLIGGGGGGGSRWGWYASIVQSQVETALHANPRTRSAVMQMKIRLWADPSGRINRVQIDSSSGDPDVDAAIRNEVLAGLTLREPPPKDMPMPIMMRITSRKPS